MRKKRIKSGLIFEEEDIYKSPNILVRLIRKIFYENKITYETFNERVKTYYQVKRNVSDFSLSIAVSNVLSPVFEKSTLTWTGFNKIIEIIFNGVITQIEVDILTEKNDIMQKYSVKL